MAGAPDVEPVTPAGRRVRTTAVAVLLLTSLVTPLPAAPAAAQATTYTVSSWTVVEYPNGQPECGIAGWIRDPGAPLRRQDCGFVRFGISPATAGVPVTLEVIAPDGTVVFERTANTNANGELPSTQLAPTEAWGVGTVTLRGTIVGQGEVGAGTFPLTLNPLRVRLTPDADAYQPGVDDITVDGTVEEHDLFTCCVDQFTPVPATVTLELVDAEGTVLATAGPVTASSDGTFSATFPASATAGVSPGPETRFRTTLAVRATATYDDSTPYLGTDGAPHVSGEWMGTGRAPVKIVAPPSGLLLEASFVSSRGWVEPGEAYPFRVFVRNYDAVAHTGAVVHIPPPPSVTFTAVTPLEPGTSATIQGDGSITWTLGTVPASPELGVPTVRTLVVEARAADLAGDPEVVWKDLSATATLTADGLDPVVSSTHGPKVIPPTGGYETARFGDRPFPVIPVAYRDRPPEVGHSSAGLADVINSPDLPGSTFNLFQEMSYGQLFPQGDVPSAGIATATFDVDWRSQRYQTQGWSFSQPDPSGACHGSTVAGAEGVPLIYPERIRDGWYQLPGDTDYYGDDATSAGSIAGALTGVGPLFQIDNACGPTGKLVLDAVHIADPEVDYNDFDTDKDGVVDFVMVIYTGIGGNGASQTSVPPYDNVWPHSSSLEFYYTDPATGLKGYITDDQLTDLEGHPQCFLDTTYTAFDDCASAGGTGDDSLPVPVRVGPYNVNPETVFESASVISHEYGHSLGLPDFYSLGSRETYGTWNLMAADHSQHMDIFGRQELGWVVPQPLTELVDETGALTVTGWRDGKVDTGEILWFRPDGTPYTLSAADGDQNIHNGQAYVVKLPARQLIDPAKVAEGASPDHLYWSVSGNDFGCAPTGGHNLDVFLPELADLDPGTTVTLTFQSLFDIEWDFDYGFVMVSTDGGQTYQSLPSEAGVTRPATDNPNAVSCQAQFGNGITGSSGSYAAGTADLDRVLGDYPDPVFLTDRYDLSGFVGQPVVLRFSYATDAGLARPGWFIDDLRVEADGQVIYETDFESPTDPRLFPGGCTEGGRVASVCTDGWVRISASEGSAADHAYYLEMRDRSGFDLDGWGQSDRGDPTFLPGLYLMYTDETHGYGNVGTDDPPAQSPLDSQPQPGNETPNLDDAAWTAVAGDSHFDDDPADPHVDNYTDPRRDDGLWTFDFGCLAFDVRSMSGTTIGPRDFDLIGDVSFQLGDGCAPFAAPGAPPVAVAQASPTVAGVGQEVTFDGSLSSPAPGRTLIAYDWDLDYDGATFDVDSSGVTVTHSYSAPGTYTAALRVTDDLGQTATDTVTVEVLEQPPNRPPVADAGPDREVRANAPVTFSGASSSDPDKGDQLTFSWQVDPPGVASPSSGTGVEFTTTFTNDGAPYDATVTLTVTDAGGLSDVDTVTVTVLPNRPPVAVVSGPSSAAPGEVVVLDGSGSWDADGDPVSWVWDPGDGSGPVSGAVLEHVYGAEGRYTVRLTVTDAWGASGVATHVLEVRRPEVVVRHGGTDRVETAVLLSQAGWPDGSGVAVLVRADEFADALAAGPLAAELDAPLLLTSRERLDGRVVAELDRLGVGTVWLVGGTEALSAGVEQALRGRGLEVVRVWGQDRFATAAAVADVVVEVGGGVSEVLVALGADPSRDAWPDALGAATLATYGRAPVLLSLSGVVPETTVGALRRLVGVGGRVWLVGGPGVLSEGVVAQLQREGFRVGRLWGPDRYATTAAVVDRAVAVAGARWDVVVLASGLGFADALAAGPFAHRIGGVLLLVHRDRLAESAATAQRLREHAVVVDTVHIAGGPVAVSPGVADEVRTAITDP